MWLSVLTMGTGSFFATGMPRGRELGLDLMDLLGFACPMAVASAVAAVVALALAGPEWGALEVAPVLPAAPPRFAPPRGILLVLCPRGPRGRPIPLGLLE